MKQAVLFLFIIGIFSCSKDKDDNTCSNYVKGEIIAGIKNTASIEDAFSLCNEPGLQIDHMSGFFYTSPYPKDSLSSLKVYLNTKPYINTRQFSASAYIHYQTGVINVTTILFDMNLNHQQDWITTMNALNLVDTKGDTKYVVLKVPAGKEKYWLNKLKGNSRVTWTELNCIGQVQIF